MSYRIPTLAVPWGVFVVVLNLAKNRCVFIPRFFADVSCKRLRHVQRQTTPVFDSTLFEDGSGVGTRNRELSGELAKFKDLEVVKRQIDAGVEQVVSIANVGLSCKNLGFHRTSPMAHFEAS